jgi:hypothetical protein
VPGVVANFLGVSRSIGEAILTDGRSLDGRYDHVEYETGEREHYDLYADPTELANIYNSASPRLSCGLDALEARAPAGASATSCNTAEGN